MPDPQPQFPSERYALIGWYLKAGMALSTAEVAKLTGLRRRGAYRLMCRVSAVLPIYQDDLGIWRVDAAPSS